MNAANAMNNSDDTSYGTAVNYNTFALDPSQLVTRFMEVENLPEFKDSRVRDVRAGFETILMDLGGTDPIHNAITQMKVSGMWQIFMYFLRDPTRVNFENGLTISDGAGLTQVPIVRASKSKLNQRMKAQNSEFIMPNSKRVNRKGDVKKPIEPVVTTSNSFAPLTEENNEESIEMTDEVEPGDVTDATPVVQRKEPKPEPLFIFMNQEWRRICSEIDVMLDTKLTRKIEGEFVKIMPTTVDQFRTIQKFLLADNIKFYALNPKTERPLKVLLKGIPKDTPIEEVTSELTDLGYLVQKVTQLKRFQDKEPLPIFLCNLLRNDNRDTIYELNNLLGYIIRVEKYAFKGAKQCYKCQRFGHSSETCALDAKCLKCGETHWTRECNKTRETKAKCANCQGEHPANFSGCRFHPTAIKAKRELLKTIRANGKLRDTDKVAVATTTGSSFSEARTEKNVSFSDKLKNSTVPETSNKNPSDSVLNSTNPFNDTLKALERITKMLEKIQSICKALNISDFADFLKSIGSVNSGMMQWSSSL